MPHATQLLRGGTGELVTLASAPFPPGGEGKIFEVAGSNLLAKVYHHPSSDRAEKLLAMLQNPPRVLGRGRARFSIAWPVDCLLEPGGSGKCVGFLMPQMENESPLFKLYNPKARAQPVTRRLLMKAARNIAAGVRSLHERGYVVGDLNESNILVGEGGAISFVDTDSFQVRTPGRVYRCLVGKPDFTPPELQGASFPDTDRTPEHDLFGLAVLLFQLLMEGNHPFRAEFTGSGNRLPLEARIAQGLWPYGTRANLPYKPPREAPPFDALSPRIRALMRRCFEEGHQNPRRRPTAAEWEAALAAEVRSWSGRLLRRALAVSTLALALILPVFVFLSPTRTSGTVEGTAQEETAPATRVGDTRGTEAETKQAARKLEDPRLSRAHRARDAIEKEEKHLAQLQSEVLRAIESLASGTLAQERLASAGLRGLVAEHHAIARELVTKHGPYVKSTEALKKSMENGAPAFREASSVFIKYAEEEHYAGLKQEYLSLSESWQEMACVTEKRARELGSEPAEIAESMKWVERTAVFLERLENALASSPNLDTWPERQRYLEQMRKHLRGFEDLWRIIRRHHGNLRLHALAHELRQYPIAQVDQNWAAFQASLADGFSLRQRLPYYRPRVGRVGTLEIAASRGDYLIARVVAGGVPFPGDYVTPPRKTARPPQAVKGAAATYPVTGGGKRERSK